LLWLNQIDKAKLKGLEESGSWKLWKMLKVKIWIILFVILASSPVLGNQIEPKASGEIDKLIEYIKNAPCKFNRNGTWYDSNQAAEHIIKKYQYALDKGLVKSSEDFIKFAAAKSSMSGKIYKIQCENGEIIKCADWLNEELIRIRNKK